MLGNNGMNLAFMFLRFGVGQVRRRWLEPTDVLNTHTGKQLKKLSRRT